MPEILMTANSRAKPRRLPDMKRTRIAGENEIVWSSEPAPATAKPPAEADPRDALPAGTVIVRVSLERLGRRGKAVTVIAGLPLAAAELGHLARDLKQRCGCGGTIRHDAIEIQGDRRDLVAGELQRRGWRVKMVG
jgi:translation initiation factor 1